MQEACIVIPCFNEEKRIDFKEFEDFIQLHANIDFLFVNDGSSDRTADVILQFTEKTKGRASLINLEKNSGKAEAVRTGILQVCNKKKYKYVGFWDADLATPLREIPEFIMEAESKNKEIAMGSRVKRLGANIERKPSRHILGRIFSTFASIILKLPVYDSQCGAKIFVTRLEDIFAKPFITKWLFDIELLARYRNMSGIQHALDQIIEVPVKTWEEKGGSKLRFKHLLKVPFELLHINRKYNSKSKLFPNVI